MSAEPINPVSDEVLAKFPPLTKSQKNALAAVCEAFKMGLELKQDFGMHIFVIGHKDLIEQRPVHYISNYHDDEFELKLLEYATDRIKKKIAKQRASQAGERKEV